MPVVDGKYVFPGITDFVVRDGLGPNQSAKIHSVWFVARAADALGQIPTATPEVQKQMLSYVAEMRHGLVNCLATLDKAANEVKKHCFSEPKKVKADAE